MDSILLLLIPRRIEKVKERNNLPAYFFGKEMFLSAKGRMNGKSTWCEDNEVSEVND